MASVAPLVTEYLETLTPEVFLEQLKQEKKDGWACYLHYTKDVADQRQVLW